MSFVTVANQRFWRGGNCLLCVKCGKKLLTTNETSAKAHITSKAHNVRFHDLNGATLPVSLIDY